MEMWRRGGTPTKLTTQVDHQINSKAAAAAAADTKTATRTNTTTNYIPGEP